MYLPDEMMAAGSEVGLNLTILSGFSIVALTGVVVNDSLVMVDFINVRVAEGQTLRQATQISGSARFRAILLTSLTTFAGLTPLLLEKSLQAQFLIPMAASLAFGVLFATVLTLLLVPVLYQILEDLRDRLLSSKPVARSGSRHEGCRSWRKSLSVRGRGGVHERRLRRLALPIPAGRCAQIYRRDQTCAMAAWSAMPKASPRNRIATR